MDKKVFIINKSSHDYSKALEFGDLIYVTKGSMNRFSVSKMFRVFEPFVKTSKPEDYILLSGLTVMNVVFCSMFAAKHQRVNLLIYKPDRRDPGRYVKKVLIL